MKDAAAAPCKRFSRQAGRQEYTQDEGRTRAGGLANEITAVTGRMLRFLLLHRQWVDGYAYAPVRLFSIFSFPRKFSHPLPLLSPSSAHDVLNDTDNDDAEEDDVDESRSKEVRNRSFVVD